MTPVRCYSPTAWRAGSLSVGQPQVKAFRGAAFFKKLEGKRPCGCARDHAVIYAGAKALNSRAGQAVTAYAGAFLQGVGSVRPGAAYSRLDFGLGEYLAGGIRGVRNKTAARGAELVDDAVRVGGKYDVGQYSFLREIAESGLDAHHVGQKAVIKDFIPGFDPAIAPSILLPKIGHTIRGPQGIVSRSTSGFTTGRQVIARDIRELRRVYSDIPNEQLQRLIELNKAMYPVLRTKP